MRDASSAPTPSGVSQETGQKQDVKVSEKNLEMVFYSQLRTPSAGIYLKTRTVLDLWAPFVGLD